MQPGSNDDFRELVRSRTDLVALIGESVALKPVRGGREHVGLCPFHDDSNPSLTVSPERQRYKCWSCGAGGDCFSFVMEREGLDFRMALEQLAERAGLEMPKAFSRRRGNSPSGSEKMDLFKVLEWAERTLHRCLKSNDGDQARAYLLDRGFRDETIDRFAIGYHPGGWQWLQNEAKGLYDVKTLLAAGLVRENTSRGGYNDDASFRGRVVFPIRDDRGRTIAFGGRILPEDEARLAEQGRKVGKYINGSDSPLFQKSHVLYAMNDSKDAIRLSETAVVVEGYTDCIKAHQAGIGNAVAVLGTALTEFHVTLLKRFARRVVLVLDGDAAGLGAAERSLAQFLAKEVDLRVLVLPEGSDPDDFITQNGPEHFRKLVGEAPDALGFRLATAVRQARDVGFTIDSRHLAMDTILDLVSQAAGMRGTPREDLAVKEVAQKLFLDERVVRQRLEEGRQLRKDRNHATPKVRDSGTTRRVDFFGGQRSREDQMECEVLEIVFAEPSWFESIAGDLGPEDFLNEYTRAIFETCRDLAEHGHEPTYERVTSTLEDLDLKRLAADLDDSSREKDVWSKLQPTASAPSGQDAGQATNTAPRGQDAEQATETDTETTHTNHSGTDARVKRPRFLSLAVENLKWRRQERNHELSKGRMAQRPDRPTALDDETRALLLGAANFHGQRATRKK